MTRLPLLEGVRPSRLPLQGYCFKTRTWRAKRADKPPATGPR
jgi:hypothetical protein